MSLFVLGLSEVLTVSDSVNAVQSVTIFLIDVHAPHCYSVGISVMLCAFLLTVDMMSIGGVRPCPLLPRDWDRLRSCFVTDLRRSQVFRSLWASRYSILHLSAAMNPAKARFWKYERHFSGDSGAIS